MKKSVIQNKMKDIENRERNNPFRVPGDYFENMTGDLLNSVQDVKPASSGRLWTIIKPHITLAAAMVALVVITYTGLRLILPGINSSGIDNESIANYISQEVDQEVIIDRILALEQVNEPGDLQEADIVAYLVENGIDISTIIENY